MFTPNMSAESFEAFLAKKFPYDSPHWQWVKGVDYETAWNNCPDPNWLLKLGECSIVQIGQICCHWVRLILHLVEENEVRPRLAIETARFVLQKRLDSSVCEKAAESAMSIEQGDNKAMYHAAQAAGYAAIVATSKYESEAIGYAHRVGLHAANAYVEEFTYKHDFEIGQAAYKAASQAASKIFKAAREFPDTTNQRRFDETDNAADAEHKIVYGDITNDFEWMARTRMMRVQAGIVRLYVEMPALTED